MESSEIDWYAILESTIEATSEEIEKAARQLSRRYHPDRNKEESAKQKFLDVQKAKDFLLDESKRRPYDEAIRKISKRKEYDNVRNKNMDSKRRKMKEDLERKLGQHKETFQSSSEPLREERKPKRSRSDDIEALRRDAMDRMNQATETFGRDSNFGLSADELLQHRQSMANSRNNSSLNQIKIKWRKGSESHSDDTLNRLFQTFGQIEDVILLPGKGGSAVITFASHLSASAAASAYSDSDIFKVSIIGEVKRPSVFTHQYGSGESKVYTQTATGAFSDPTPSHSNSLSSVEVELMRDVQRAVERESLLRQMKEKESDSGSHPRYEEHSSVGDGVAAPNIPSASRPAQSEGINSAANCQGSRVNLVAKENDVLARMLLASKLKAGAAVAGHS
jgi:curved DNA-binding protein CbpA